MHIARIHNAPSFYRRLFGSAGRMIGSDGAFRILASAPIRGIAVWSASAKVDATLSDRAPKKELCMIRPTRISRPTPTDSYRLNFSHRSGPPLFMPPGCSSDASSFNVSSFRRRFVKVCVHCRPGYGDSQRPFLAVGAECHKRISGSGQVHASGERRHYFTLVAPGSKRWCRLRGPSNSGV